MFGDKHTNLVLYSFDGVIRPDFELIGDVILVALMYKLQKNPVKNEGYRPVTMSHFNDKGKVTFVNMVKSDLLSNSFEMNASSYCG